METIDAFHRATAVAHAVVGEINDDQFAFPTPCTEWNVRDVPNHIRTGDLLVTAWLTRAPTPDARDRAMIKLHVRHWAKLVALAYQTWPYAIGAGVGIRAVSAAGCALRRPGSARRDGVQLEQVCADRLGPDVR